MRSRRPLREGGGQRHKKGVPTDGPATPTAALRGKSRAQTLQAFCFSFPGAIRKVDVLCTAAKTGPLEEFVGCAADTAEKFSVLQRDAARPPHEKNADDQSALFSCWGLRATPGRACGHKFYRRSQ
ncbi:MAG: hypothetical protein PHO66_00665 [Eubacteriales bacterium]|nr:hypothetical protein [Eubacteriales bacterium]